MVVSLGSPSAFVSDLVQIPLTRLMLLNDSYRLISRLSLLSDIYFFKRNVQSYLLLYLIGTLIWPWALWIICALTCCDLVSLRIEK